MPCKHEGGTDECIRYVSRHCKVGRRQVNQVYHSVHRERLKDRYTRDFKSSSLGKNKTTDSGYAGELIVRTDLLLRGMDVTVPENRATPDDLHFKSSKGWVSVQVKVARVNLRTGTWTRPYARKDKPVTSDILALVNLRDWIIRYHPNVKNVPPELLT